MVLVNFAICFQKKFFFERKGESLFLSRKFILNFLYCFYGTFNIISHIFPENFIAIPQVVQKL